MLTTLASTGGYMLTTEDNQISSVFLLLNTYLSTI